MQDFAGRAMCLPIGLFTSAFLTRTLGPADYGLLVVSASIVFWLETVVSLGLSRAAVKAVAAADAWQSTASRIIAAQAWLGLGAAACLIALAPALAAWLAAPDLGFYLRLHALQVPILALANTHLAILIARGRFSRRALLSALLWVGRLIFIVLLVGGGLRVSGAILGGIAASAAVLTGARLTVHPPLRSKTRPMRHLWRDALPLTLYSAGILLFARLDLMFVKAMSPDPGAAGFYGAVQNLTIVPGLFAAAFSPLLLSKLSLLSGRGQHADARALVRQALRTVCWLLPFAGMAAGAASEIVTAIYGAPFLPSGPLLVPLIFAAVGTAAIPIAEAALLAAGRAALVPALTLPLVPLAAGAHTALIPQFGPLGAATATAALAWLGAGAAALAVCKTWRVLPPAGTLARSLLICGLAYILSAAYPTPGAWVALKLLIVSAAIAGAFLLLREFSPEERALAHSVFRRPTG